MHIRHQVSGLGFFCIGSYYKVCLSANSSRRQTAIFASTLRCPSLPGSPACSCPERDEMTFRIELKDESVDKEKLAEKLNKRFQSVCLVKADKIEFVSRGSIAEEAKIMEDRRRWE